MPVTLDKFILGLAEKAGIAADDKRLAEIFSHTEISRINVNDDLSRDINQSLLSVDDAKNDHPAIKTHYFGEIMSNVDRVLTSVYKDYAFTDDEIKDLNKERSSTKRINLVAAKLKAKFEAAKPAESAQEPAADVKKLQETIDSLNGQLRDLRDAETKLKDTHKKEMSNFKLNSQLASKLGLKKTVFDAMPVEAKDAAIRTILEKELLDNQAELTLDENGALIIKKKDGSNFYNAENKLISVDDFIDTTLTKNKLLQQTPNPATAGGGGNGQQQQSGQQHQNGSGTPIVTGQPRQNNDALKALLQESTKDLNNPNPMDIVAGTQS